MGYATPAIGISVCSGPFRSAAFHVVCWPAQKDTTCILGESGNADESCRWPMFGIFCQVHHYIMGREVPRQLLVAFRQIQEMQVGFTIGLTFGQSQMQTQFALSGLF